MVAITVGKDPCYFLREFFKIKDLRVLIKFKFCAGAVRGCHMFLLTVPLRPRLHETGVNESAKKFSVLASCLHGNDENGGIVFGDPGKV